MLYSNSDSLYRQHATVPVTLAIVRILRIASWSIRIVKRVHSKYWSKYATAHTTARRSLCVVTNDFLCSSVCEVSNRKGGYFHVLVPVRALTKYVCHKCWNTVCYGSCFLIMPTLVRLQEKLLTTEPPQFSFAPRKLNCFGWSFLNLLLRKTARWSFVKFLLKRITRLEKLGTMCLKILLRSRKEQCSVCIVGY